jgi:hypothetical protein
MHGRTIATALLEGREAVVLWLTHLFVSIDLRILHFEDPCLMFRQGICLSLSL